MPRRRPDPFSEVSALTERFLMLRRECQYQRNIRRISQLRLERAEIRTMKLKAP